MISWSFLKKIADFNQWPLGCIGNFIENSVKESVGSKNIFIDVKCYDKKVYISNSNSDSLSHPQSHNLEDNLSKIGEKIIVLSIKDDGCGINTKDFNQIMYSFAVNEKKEYSFFKFGVSLKVSALRLANAFLIITKTEEEVSLGLISKNLQVKMDTDFILTPVVNFKIDRNVNITTNFENYKLKYTTRSNYPQQSLNLIMIEVKFLFNDPIELFKYIESFDTGTHIFLYDLKQISSLKSELNRLTNYELLFDHQKKDILFNYFQIQVGESNFIDCSLKSYARFLFLKTGYVNLFLLNEKVNFKNPLQSVYNLSRNIPEAVKIKSNLKYDKKSADCVFIEGNIYQGIIYKENYFRILSNSYDFNFENSFEENECFNGILIYRNNRLVCRFGQNKLGDISYFIKKYQKEKTSQNIFSFSGFVEVPSSFYDLLYNKMEFKDQAIYALFYSKVKSLIQKMTS